MKILKLPLILLAIAATLFAAVPVTQPSGEFVINTNQSTNLNANFLRIIGGRINVDNSFTNWSLGFRWEAWRTNTSPHRIVTTGELLIDMAELKTLVNAGNPKNALKAAILNSASLVEKP